MGEIEEYWQPAKFCCSEIKLIYSINCLPIFFFLGTGPGMKDGENEEKGIVLPEDKILYAPSKLDLKQALLKHIDEALGKGMDKIKEEMDGSRDNGGWNNTDGMNYTHGEMEKPPMPPLQCKLTSKGHFNIQCFIDWTSLIFKCKCIE